MLGRVLTKRVALLLFMSALAPPMAAAYHQPGQEWVEHGAYTLRQRELSLGLRQWAVGLLDEVTLGVSPALWIVGPFFGSLVPNAELKIRDFLHERLAVAASLGFVYVNGKGLLDAYAPEKQAHASLLALTASLHGSLRITDAVSSSAELGYVALGASGGAVQESIAGTALSSSLRLGASTDWRITRLLALRLSGQVLLQRARPHVQVDFQADARTRVNGELRIGAFAPQGAWQLLPAVVLSGANVNFLAGVGYGYQWLPFCGLVLPGRRVVFDLDFFVRF